MKTRDAVLVYQEVQTSDKSSKTINLALVDPISAIAFEFEAKNGTTSNIQNPFPFTVTKIEVVEGSDTLASLSFPQLQALQWYKDGKQPELREDENGGATEGATQVMGAMLLFGRHLGDKDYALDPLKFKNLQLKITWDLNVTRDVSATLGFATGTFKISVIAKVMEDMSVRPLKFLMAKEIVSWTGATSGDERLDLPVDKPYRFMMLRCYKRAVGTVYDVNECVTKIKLTADSDKFVPVERFTKQYGDEMAQLYGAALIWKRFKAAHNDELWFEINKEPQLGLTPTVLNRTAAYGWCWSGAAALLFGDSAGGTVSSRERIDGRISGHGLHHTLPIRVCDGDDPAVWFDPTVYKKLELVCTQGAASANSLVAEQVHGQ